VSVENPRATEGITGFRPTEESPILFGGLQGVAKVLVAEDDHKNRELLEGTLAKWGYEVVSVENGFQAVGALLGDSDIRLALVDQEMPGMDGTKVCRVIRSLDRFVYAILLLEHGEPEDMARALEAGASDCIAQPLDTERLRDLLKDAEREVTSRRG
jgi:CheY-like chemotaxis protein